MARLAKLALAAFLWVSCAPRAHATWGKFFGNVSVNGLTNAGPTNLQSTLTVGGNTTLSGPLSAPNVEMFLSSQAFTAVTAVTINMTAPSSATVHCSLRFVQNTALGYPALRFNGDSALHYNWQAEGMSTGGPSNTSSNSDTVIAPLVTAQSVTAGSSGAVDFTYINSTDAAGAIILTGTSRQWNVNGFATHWAGAWVNGTVPTSMTINVATGGTETGFVRCTYSSY